MSRFRQLALTALLAVVFIGSSAPGITIAQSLEELVLVCYKVKKDEGKTQKETLEVKDEIRGERFVTLKSKRKAQQVCVWGVADQISD